MALRKRSDSTARASSPSRRCESEAAAIAPPRGGLREAEEGEPALEEGDPALEPDCQSLIEGTVSARRGGEEEGRGGRALDDQSGGTLEDAAEGDPDGASAKAAAMYAEGSLRAGASGGGVAGMCSRRRREP